MTRTATGHHSDLSRIGCAFCNDNALIFSKPDDVRMGLQEALYGIFDNLIRIVYETLHTVSCIMSC